MKSTLKIGIIGAGPAGLAAALALHQRGLSPVIHERFDDAAPVGSGLMLQPTGMTVLHALGLLETVLAKGQRIDHLSGTDAASGRRVLDVRYDAVRGSRFGLGIQRSALFSTLHEAVKKAGIAIRTGFEAVATKQDRDAITLVSTSGQSEGPYDLVIDASGARSRLSELSETGMDGASSGGGRARDLEFGAFWSTLDAGDFQYEKHALSQRYEKAKIMVGILPVGRAEQNAPERLAFFWSLKVKDADHVRARGLPAFKGDVLRIWPDLEPLLKQIVDWDQLTLARYRHRTLDNPVSGRLVTIGDAAHSTSPQLGQGANMALLDMAALVYGLEHCDDLRHGLDHYRVHRRNHVRLFQAMSLMFTPFYQSDSTALAFLRDTFVASAARLPPVSALLALIVSGMLANPLSGTGLTECDWSTSR